MGSGVSMQNLKFEIVFRKKEEDLIDLINYSKEIIIFSDVEHYCRTCSNKI